MNEFTCKSIFLWQAINAHHGQPTSCDWCGAYATNTHFTWLAALRDCMLHATKQWFAWLITLFLSAPLLHWARTFAWMWANLYVCLPLCQLFCRLLRLSTSKLPLLWLALAYMILGSISCFRGFSCNLGVSESVVWLHHPAFVVLPFLADCVDLDLRHLILYLSSNFMMLTQRFILSLSEPEIGLWPST